MKHPFTKAALLMAVILCVSLGISSFTYRSQTDTADTVTVTAAFYPMYTAALQIVGDADGVTVQCLTAPTSGCLHDYQLSPSEMTALADTDIVLLSGAGAESFLTAALSALPSLTCIDASDGVEIKHVNDGHHHDHDHEHGELNSHLWTSPLLYAQQVKNLRDGLCKADPDRADIYTKNATAYLAKIEPLIQRANAISLTDTAILFHDSAVYFADNCHLSVGAVLPAETESGLSAAQLTGAAAAIADKRALFVCDDQYPVNIDLLSPYAASFSVISLDTAVTPKDGVADAERWLWAMDRNLQQLEVLTP